MKKYLDFSDPKKEDGYLSNFYNRSFTVDGIRYSNVEIFYQINKFGDDKYSKEYKDLIMSVQNKPGKVKVLSSQTSKGWRFKWATDLQPIIDKYKELGVKIREDWDDVKLTYMVIGVDNKFKQNPDLMKKLLKTKDYTIREISKKDRWWAIGKNGEGLNMLGKLLMCARDIYLEKANQIEVIFED